MKKKYNSDQERREAKNLRRRLITKAKHSILKWKEYYIERIPFSSCWYWLGALDGGGYGMIKHHGKSEKAHRYLYRLYKGDFDPQLHLMHRCDNPSCVNPDHLTPGTVSDNLRDMYRKQRRTQRGSLNGNFKHGRYVK